MPNPLYNDMMGAVRPESNNNYDQMMQALNSFAQTLRGNPKQIVEQMIQSGQMTQALNSVAPNLRGTPKQMVMQLLQSGQMTQAQYNQIAQEANNMIGTM